MPIVAIYRLLLTFQPEHLEAGKSLQGILFLRQEKDARTDTTAVAVAQREHRILQATVEAYGVLQVDVLDTPGSAHFRASHEKALREGSALVYYVD